MSASGFPARAPIPADGRITFAYEMSLLAQSVERLAAEQEAEGTPDDGRRRQRRPNPGSATERVLAVLPVGCEHAILPADAWALIGRRDGERRRAGNALIQLFRSGRCRRAGQLPPYRYYLEP